MVLYEILLDDFKKNFNPVFKEQGIETFCYLGTEAIIKKNEADQSYTWLKEYPPEIKTFILDQITKVLKPKYFLATLNRVTGVITKKDGEVVLASLAINNYLLNILSFLEVTEINGLLVRQLDEQYEFRPVIEGVENGYNLSLKRDEVLKFMQTYLPHLLPESLKLKENIKP